MNCKQQVVVILHRNDFNTNGGEHEDIYAVLSWYKIVEEWSSEGFFSDDIGMDGNTDESGNYNESREVIKAATAITNTINARGRVVDSDLAQMR